MAAATVGLSGILLFALGLHMLGVAAIARRALALSKDAVAFLATPSRTDDEREHYSRATSVSLAGSFVRIVGLSLAALALPAVAVVGADRLGVSSLASTGAFLNQWPVVAGGIVLAFAAILYGK